MGSGRATALESPGKLVNRLFFEVHARVEREIDDLGFIEFTDRDSLFLYVRRELNHF
jgi:hypothetical protein